MNMTRKTFCASLAGSTVTLLLQGCGGGGYSSGGSTPAATGSTCGANGPDISANHGHSLAILKADLDSPTDKTYNLSSGASDGHIHSVTFTVAQLATLKSGTSVTVASTITAADPVYDGGTHAHNVKATVLIASCS